MYNNAPTMDLDSSKNLYEYHSVFASTLAAYIELKKQIDGGKLANALTQTRYEEARSLLRSNLIYAIMLKRKDVENEGIPEEECGLISWLTAKEREYKGKGLNEMEVLEALYALMVRKQEVAGLTANSEKSYTSKMNMLISQVERDLNR